VKIIVICDDCPCENTDYENGSTCNISGEDLDSKRGTNDKWYTISKDCRLKEITTTDGNSFFPQVAEYGLFENGE